MYEALFGPIPPGLVIDHVAARGCTRTDCCSPEHLEAVTQAENTRRGRSFAPANAAKNRCGTCGAEFDMFNTYWRPNRGGRDCRRCVRDRGHRYRLRKRQLAAA
ncbi:MAG: HNH endonuclease signature motif containing protein [Streptosporangiaceae bacterium]